MATLVQPSPHVKFVTSTPIAFPAWPPPIDVGDNGDGSQHDGSSDCASNLPPTGVDEREPLSESDVALTLARYRGASGDGGLDSLRLRYAMTSVGMSEYEQRVVLGGEFRRARANLHACAKNIAHYSRYEYGRCEEFLEALDSADLSYWAQPSAFARVLYGIAVADHRRHMADSALKRAWDVMHLVFIFYFVVASTYVNVLYWQFDDGSELPNGRRLLNSFYGVLAFFLIDLFLTTQLATTDEEGHVLMEPSRIMRRKLPVLIIDGIGVLPLDFIFQAAGLWWPFAVFRFMKYIKVFRTLWLFEVVNRGVVNRARLRFYYELKPIFIGTFWLLMMIHVGSLLHAYANDSRSAETHFPLFIQSFITVATAVLASTVDIYAYNNYDRTIIVTFMLMTFVLQGIVVAKFSSLLLSRNVEDENQRHLRSTLSIIRHYKVPHAIQREVLSYQLHDLNDNATHHMQDLEVLPEKMCASVRTFSKLSAVRQVPLFADASRGCQELLAKMLARRQFPPERNMVTNGEIGDDMFMITHGYAEVVIFTGMIVATLSRGDFFGELALFSSDGKRMATVRALTYVDAWRLERRQFLLVCAQHTEFFEKIVLEVEKRKVDSQLFRAAVAGAMRDGNLSGKNLELALAENAALQSRQSSASQRRRSTVDGSGARPVRNLRRLTQTLKRQQFAELLEREKVTQAIRNDMPAATSSAAVGHRQFEAIRRVDARLTSLMERTAALTLETQSLIQIAQSCGFDDDPDTPR